MILISKNFGIPIGICNKIKLPRPYKNYKAYGNIPTYFNNIHPEFELNLRTTPKKIFCFLWYISTAEAAPKRKEEKNLKDILPTQNS